VFLRDVPYYLILSHIIVVIPVVNSICAVHSTVFNNNAHGNSVYQKLTYMICTLNRRYFYWAVPLCRRLVAGVSLWSSGFDPRPGHVELTVNQGGSGTVRELGRSTVRSIPPVPPAPLQLTVFKLID